MNAALWMLLGLLTWLAAILTLLAGAVRWTKDTMALMDAAEVDHAADDAALDSVRAALEPWRKEGRL